MDTLSVVRDVPFSRSPARQISKHQLLVFGVALNLSLTLGASAFAFSMYEQLEHLGHRTQQHADGLTSVQAQARALESGLVEARAAVSAHSREEVLFFKTLILRPGIDHALARRIAGAVERECARTGQDPNLVLSIIAVESSFNPNAVSVSGAVGLMQVMPMWKEELGVDELNDPEVSIHAGVQILSRYQHLYGDLELALAAYNVGPSQVSEALASGTSPASAYSAKVVALQQRLGAIDRP
jgi:hypothetical protein